MEPPEEIEVSRATLLRLQDALEEMTGRLKNQLRWLKQRTDLRSRHWRCRKCGHVTAYSLPMAKDAASTCEKCQHPGLEAVKSIYRVPRVPQHRDCGNKKLAMSTIYVITGWPSLARLGWNTVKSPEKEKDPTCDQHNNRHLPQQ